MLEQYLTLDQIFRGIHSSQQLSAPEVETLNLKKTKNNKLGACFAFAESPLLLMLLLINFYLPFSRLWHQVSLLLWFTAWTLWTARRRREQSGKNPNLFLINLMVHWACQQDFIFWHILTVYERLGRKDGNQTNGSPFAAADYVQVETISIN